jgi:hypothetical protein
VAQDRSQLEALVNTVRNVYIPQKVGYFLSEQLLASQKGLCIPWGLLVSQSLSLTCCQDVPVSYSGLRV